MIVNRPVPVTRPVWRTPIARPGSHSVISIRSVRRIGPTLVTHSKRVPTPSVLVGHEPDHLGVGHPVDVGVDLLDGAPTPSPAAASYVARLTPDPRHAGVRTARSVSAAVSGGMTLIITPVPRSKPAAVTRFGHRCTCQWYCAGVLVRRGVEPEVVGDVAERRR